LNYPTTLTGKYLKWDSYNPNDSEIDFASTSVDGTVTSPLRDLSTSGSTGKLLSFKTDAMYCCNANETPFYIEISENGGGIWGPRIIVDLGIDRNQFSTDVADPMKVLIDISSEVPNLTANTQIRFGWEGTSADGNGQYNTHYYWLIDDIAIYERPLINLSLTDLWVNDIFNDYEYTSIPTMFADFLTVQGKIKNIGANTPTGVTLTINAVGALGGTYTQTGGVLTNSFSATDIDTITFTSTLDMSTWAVDTYTITGTLNMTETDEDLTDNVFVRSIKITNNVYGAQNFEEPLYFGSVGNDAGPNATTSIAMGFGNWFYVPVDADLHGVNLKIGKSSGYPTTVGGELYVQLYMLDATASDFNSSHAYFAGDWLFPITSTMVPATNSVKDVTLNLHDSQTAIPTLLGGNYYMALVNHDGGSANHFCYLENPFDDDYSVNIYGDFGTTPGDNWFTLGTQVVTDLNFDGTLGIKEATSDITIGFIAPNPTTGATTISYSLKGSSDISIQIVDVTGKVILTQTEVNQAAGSHLSSFDATTFANGIYYVNIVSNYSNITQKFIKK
jgi:hypothetical protein